MSMALRCVSLKSCDIAHAGLLLRLRLLYDTGNQGNDTPQAGQIMSNSKTASAKTFREIYGFFNTPVVDIDCGQMCKHLNNGSPVCCDTSNAIPVVQKSEWKALKQRTDMWRPFKPGNSAAQEIVDGLHDSCKAVECRGAQFCERDNRSLACRTFPFFPYITNKDELIGLSYYWTFEDRC
jgi:hypothetical protein